MNKKRTPSFDGKKVATFEGILNNQIDITGADVVELSISHDGSVVWVNVDGVCACRVCRVNQVVVDDRREAK